MKNIFNSANAFVITLLVTGTLFTTSLQANSSECYPECCPESCSGQGFLSASLIYWRAHQGGLSECFPSKEIDFTKDGEIFSELKGKRDDLHFEWRPGFTVGGGYQFTNNWDVGLFYTDFRSKAEREHSHFQKNRWKLHFQVADLVVAYEFESCSCFTVRPFLGLRGALIDQSVKAFQSRDCLASGFRAHNTQDFSGLGPLFGIEANFDLGCGFSLYGDLGGSFLYGHYRGKFKKAELFSGGGIFCNLRQHEHSCQSILDAGFGITWETCFCNSMRLFISLGVEHHCYFDHNRIGNYGDLNLDGGTFSATVLF